MIPLGVLASAYVAPAGGGALLAYIGSATSTATGTVHTFTDFPIGTAYTGREIVLGIVGAGTSNTTVSSVTIDGVTATLDTTTYTGWMTSRIARGAPTGATATVVVTFAASRVQCVLFAFRSSVPLAVGGSGRTNSAVVTLDQGCATQTGSFVVVVGGSYASEAMTWTNATEVEQVLAESVSQHGVATATGTGSPVTYSISTSALTQKQIHVVSYVPA